MMVKDFNENPKSERRKTAQRTELGNRRGPVKTRRGKTLWTTEKMKEDRKEDGDSGSKSNYLRKEEWKRK